MNAELSGLLLAGCALGALHSLDPDHVAAMSTLVGRHDGPAVRAARKGMWWGIGHTLAIVVLGLALLFTGAQLSGAWTAGFELTVGLLLIGLGIARLRSAGRRLGYWRHLHAGDEHVHFHLGHHGHSHAPVWIGLLHGAAGSAGVMALLPALVVDSVPVYLMYVLAFGLGSTVTMMMVCGGLGDVFRAVGTRATRAAAWLGATAGLASMAIGLWWIGDVLRA